MKNSKTLTPTTSIIALVSIASIGILIACGPYFAPRLLYYKNTIINNPDTGVDLMFTDNDKSATPHLHLENLPKRLRATYDADIADLKKAAPKLAKKVMQDYAAIRSDMIISAWDQSAIDLTVERPKNWLDEATLALIPKEFSLYLQGAVAYRSGLSDKAREQWKALLALPAEKRKYKTIWAAWMLARTSTADGEAMQWYAKVKQYKKDGFPDSIQVTERDWTSFFSLKSGDYSTALSIYIKEGKNGDSDSVAAANNINEVFYQALQKHQKDLSSLFKSFSKNPEHALAFSYYLTRYSHNNGEALQNKKRGHDLILWIKTLRESDRKNVDKELGICAASAYAINDEKSLALCLKSMLKPTTESLWLKAKLATRKGKLTEAANVYQQATESIKKEGVTPGNSNVYYYGNFRVTGEIANNRYFNLYSEYACVELGQKNYGKALDLFLTADNSPDAAYIAETLLSPVDLLNYYRNSKVAQKSDWIRALLTRKLMRNEYFKDAKSFALDKHLKVYDEYIRNYRVGINKSTPIEKRVEAFIIASSLMRRHGNDLFFLENGSRPFLRISAAGRTMHEKYDQSVYSKKPLPNANEFIPKITPDELKRIKQNYVRISPVSTKERLAADLLYRAAILLPKNNEQAAKLLWEAGVATIADPKVADKYYQALVKTCPKTPLGKACDERRWFIHINELKNPS